MPDRLGSIYQQSHVGVYKKSCTGHPPWWHVHRARGHFVDVRHRVCEFKVTRPCASVRPLISAREQANAQPATSTLPDVPDLSLTLARSPRPARPALRRRYKRIWVGLCLNHVFEGGAANLAWSIPRAFRSTAAVPSVRRSRSGTACHSARDRKRRTPLTRYRLRRSIVAEPCVAFNRGQCPPKLSARRQRSFWSDGLPSPARVAPARANYNLTRQYEPWVHRRGTPAEPPARRFSRRDSPMILKL